MCIILDVNMLSRFKKHADEDMRHVWNWLQKKNSKIAYSTTQKFKDEWKRGGGDSLMRELERNKKLKLVSNQDVLIEQSEVEGKIESNDSHIIALARVAQVKVLVSQDKELINDFTNRELVARGKVYQRAEHAHLLNRLRCP